MKKPGNTSPGPGKGTNKTTNNDLPTSDSHQIPLQSLKDFRFPTETGNSNLDALANASNELLTTGNDNLESTLAALDREATKTMNSTKTKASKRDKAKKFQKRVVLKIRDLISRAKAKAQKGTKKLKPKTPALKLKVEMDNPAAAVGDATGLPVPQPPAPLP